MKNQDALAPPRCLFSYSRSATERVRPLLNALRAQAIASFSMCGQSIDPGQSWKLWRERAIRVSRGARQISSKSIIAPQQHNSCFVSLMFEEMCLDES
jgi:hypothetical protein